MILNIENDYSSEFPKILDVKDTLRDGMPWIEGRQEFKISLSHPYNAIDI
jgi:hypothetical protein